MVKGSKSVSSKNNKKKTVKKPVSVKKSRKKIMKSPTTKKSVVKKVVSKRKVVKKTTKKSIKKVGRKVSKKIMKKSVKKANKKKVVKKKTKKKTKKVLVEKSKINKYHQNPIISPKKENMWEAEQTFNPGAIELEGKIHFLYRAVGSDAVSRLGYANSSDGFSVEYREDTPVYEDNLTESNKFSLYSLASGGSWSGAEDPRIVRVGDEDQLYMTFTSCSDGLRMGMATIKIKDFLKKRWKWSKTYLISPPGEVHKNWLIFPEKINGKYAILHSIVPKIEIEYLESLEFEEVDHIKSPHKMHGDRPNKSKKEWDYWIRGPGPPPIKTKDGWLLIYQAMSAHDKGKYKVGAMLLDSKNPKKILYKSKEPILIPEECYEMEGNKAGVVYATGAIIKDGELIIYYGGADNYVCVAHEKLETFMKILKGKKKGKLSLKLKKGVKK